MSRFKTGSLVAFVLVALLSTKAASAKPKVTKPKKRSTPTTLVAPKTPTASKNGAGARNFSCIGSNTQRVTERVVAGTIDANATVTNVTVTQTVQIIDNVLVEQPVVVLTSPNPVGKHELSSDLIIFQLNELPRVATAADVDRLVTVYLLNIRDVMAPGPTFEEGLYFTTYKGAKGTAANEYKWSLVSSLAYSGAYTLKCTYV
jgi:hypothetical protein